MKCLNRSGKQNLSWQVVGPGLTFWGIWGLMEVDKKWAPWRVGEVVVKVYFKWLGSLRSHWQFTIRNRFVIYCSYISSFPFFCFSPKCVFPGNPGSRNDLKKRHPGYPLSRHLPTRPRFRALNLVRKCMQWSRPVRDSHGDFFSQRCFKGSQQ